MHTNTVELYLVGGLILVLSILLAFAWQGDGHNQSRRDTPERSRWSGPDGWSGGHGWSPGGGPAPTVSGATAHDAPGPHGRAHHGPAPQTGSEWGPDGGSPWSGPTSRW